MALHPMIFRTLPIPQCILHPDGACPACGAVFPFFAPFCSPSILTYVFITKTNGLILWLRRRTLTRNTFLHKSLNAHNINLISTTLTIGIVLTVILLMSLGDLPLDSRRAYPRDADQAGGDFGRHEKQQQPAAVGFEHAAQQYPPKSKPMRSN